MSVTSLFLIGANSLASVCTAASSRAPASTKLTGVYNDDKRVTQVCLIQTVLTKAIPELNAVIGDVPKCSGILISSHQILTAGHCIIKPEQTTISCSCGEADHQKKIDYSVQAEPMIHPDYQPLPEMGDLAKVDAQIVELGKVIPKESDCEETSVKPMPWVSSLQEVKRLMASGKCYLSGWGIDNSNMSALHAAKIPRGNQIDTYAIPKSNVTQNASSVDVISFYNDAYRAHLSHFMDRVRDSLIESGASDEKIQQLNNDHLKQYDHVMSYISGDPNRLNSARQGDSGGAFFCTDENGIDRLVGIIHSEWQESVLTSSPVIRSWIDQNTTRAKE